MSFINSLKESFNETVTENGDKSYKSTLNSNLDVFAFAGSSRNNDEIKNKTKRAFIKALDENHNLALRNLLNIREFRNLGLGERDLFIDLFKTLPLVDQLKLISVIPEIGRWDDVVKLFGFNSKLDEKIVDVIRTQLFKDLENLDKNEEISLLAKWLPSDKGSKTPKETSELLHALGFRHKRDYRKVLSKLRAQLNLIETNLTKKDYKKINLEKVPSRAFNKYKNALTDHMYTEMLELIDNVNSGTGSIKTSGITPDELVAKVLYDNEQTESITEAQWKSLKKIIGLSSTLVMADVSGSMFGKPLEVAIALAIYFSEQIKGEFHNTFLTFSSNPQLVSFTDNMTLHEKVSEAENADWGFNTDLRKAFEIILNTAVKHNLPQEELPKTLLIASDMQFDEAVSNADSTFEYAKKLFKENGYELPNVVFWNINASTIPVSNNETGVALVSGYSPSIMNAIINTPLEEFTPEGVMMIQLMNDYYSSILKTAGYSD